METRAKTNTEFQSEVNETLARHESGIDQANNNITHINHNIDQMNATLQTVVAELQALRSINIQNFVERDINSFSQAETSNHRNSTQPDLFPSTQPVIQNLPQPDIPHSNQIADRNYTQLKLSFPRFNGVDPNGWIYKAEQYFEFKNIHHQQRVQLASFHLEDDALQWHCWLSKCMGHLNWSEFTQAVLHRFGPTDYKDPSEALTRLRQTSTVNIYQTKFEKLSQRIDNLPENYLVGCFIAWLCDEIRLDVKVKQPRTLLDAIRVARLVEERTQLQRKSTLVFRTIGVATHQKNNPNTLVRLLGPPPITKPNQTSPGGFKRITSQEAKDRRARGLCFYCDEKFIPGHRCQRPQLFMIEDNFTGEELQVNGTVEELPDTKPIPEISFHAISGTNHPQTIRVIGKLKNQDITVLIDGGSTHNFLNQSMVSRLGLPVTRDKKFQVMVANREKIECNGRCLGLTMEFKGAPYRWIFTCFQWSLVRQY